MLAIAVAIFFFFAYSLMPISPPIPQGTGTSNTNRRPQQNSDGSYPTAQQYLATETQQLKTPQPEPSPDWTDGNSVPPKTFTDTSQHPIQHLIQSSRDEFDKVVARQSKSLGDAVEEYRRRYGIPPPPHFDKWFEFAQENNVQLVDEFDTIHEVLTPFWGLKPQTIRERAKEALGFSDSALIGVAIRNHAVSHIENGPDWQQNATVGMMQSALPYLPDMDLAFNLHDEPRVVLPHDDLARLVQKAKTKNMPTANKGTPVNDFSPHSPELSDKNSFEETKFTRFNSIPHQATWTNSRMSCSPDSPARALEDDDMADDMSKYALSEMGYIYNNTAMSDICLSPSLRATYGFFDRPNAYKVAHDLFPIFSQSKISSYADILYPSPWYWSEQAAYKEDRDVAWAKKHDDLFWRGSTTGGFSRNGGWRRQHRQHAIGKLNAADDAQIYDQDSSSSQWAVSTVARGDYRKLMDAYFSHVGQCDPGDCEAQAQFFDVKDRVDMQDAWKHKHLLDMDGNAFSGRFYTFLQSRSQVFKLAIFREWHAEWLRPWLHYVPLSMQGHEWLDAVRFFGIRGQGAAEAEKMAEESREWAGKAVRKVDLEAWFFRLLLE